MSKFINLLLPGGSGGTFLDWTINYLTSESLTKNSIAHKYYVNESSDIEIRSNIRIVDNPIVIEDSNAHRYKKTHVSLSVFPKLYDTYYENYKDAPGIFSAYIVDDMIINSTSTSYSTVINEYPEIFKNVVFGFTPLHIDLIFVWQYDRSKKSIRQEYTNQEKLDIWNNREIWSMSYHNMIKNQILSEDCNRLQNTHVLDFDLYINNFENTVHDFISCIGLKVIDERIPHWRGIYKQWLNVVDINFFNDLSIIIENIVNHKSYSLKKYNMTLGKEIVLCKKLLFEHNIALKMSGIKKMPLDTKDWSSLLEENIYHDLSSYNCINS